MDKSNLNFKKEDRRQSLASGGKSNYQLEGGKNCEILYYLLQDYTR